MTPLAANVLVGPTASGKSAVAQYLAQLGRPPRPVISADSMTVYRGMDLGTAKPDAHERAQVPSFGFDLATPDQPFSVGDYLAAVRAAAPALAACRALPIVVGGTGLYIRCLTEGLDTTGPMGSSSMALLTGSVVVPGVSDTTAAACPVRTFSRLDFPALRRPNRPICSRSPLGTSFIFNGIPL